MEKVPATLTFIVMFSAFVFISTFGFGREYAPHSSRWEHIESFHKNDHSGQIDYVTTYDKETAEETVIYIPYGSRVVYDQGPDKGLNDDFVQWKENIYMEWDFEVHLRENWRKR